MIFKENQLVNIRVGKNPCSRTRNRITENGPLFRTKRWEPSSRLFDGTPALLIQSAKNDWTGWLPLEEIFVEVVEEV